MEIQKTPTSRYMETTTEMVPTLLCHDHIDHNLWLDIFWFGSRIGMMYNCLNFNNEFIYPQALKENIYRLPVRLVKDVK